MLQIQHLVRSRDVPSATEQRVYTCYQGQKQINDKYAEKLEAYADVIEASRGQFGDEPGYLSNILCNEVRAANPRNPTTLELEEARHTLRDNVMAALLILGVYNTRYCTLKMELRNLYNKGQDNYLQTMAIARYFGRGGNIGGVAFAQVNKTKI